MKAPRPQNVIGLNPACYGRTGTVIGHSLPISADAVFLSYVILFSSIIPIVLYVTLDGIRYIRPAIPVRTLIRS